MPHKVWHLHRRDAVPIRKPAARDADRARVLGGWSSSLGLELLATRIVATVKRGSRSRTSHVVDDESSVLVPRGPAPY